MNVIADIDLHLVWRDSVAAAKAWRDAERQQAAEHSEAVRRILEMAPNTPDPCSDRLTRLT